MESHDTSQLSKSRFHKAVDLDDWWLIEAENDLVGRRLAVGGLSIKHGAARLFSSAPIIKRINPFCLETADDITVNLGSFINKSRTTENGFSHEVFSHFQYGFPPYWEEYAKNYFAEDSTGSVSVFDKLAVDSAPKEHEETHDAELEGAQDTESVVDNNAKVSDTSRNKAKRKLPYDPYASLLTRERMKKDFSQSR